MALAALLLLLTAAGAAECDAEGDAEVLLQSRRLPSPDGSYARKMGTEVFVMLPLDLFDPSNATRLKNPAQLRLWFAQLEEVGVTGLMCDTWWGLTEPEPRKYQFQGYRELVDLVKEFGFKLQLVTSFHANGNAIPLPSWLLSARDIWYKDASGSETKAYISLWSDDVEVEGRTPVEMYRDWMQHFKAIFAQDLGATITELMVGLGTDGELKYPSYENGPWQFPGIGEFQCYDEYALESLRKAAEEAGEPCWGQPPPLNETGNYNSEWNATIFFTSGYKTAPAKFFLQWYSQSLETHARKILRAAREVFGHAVHLSAKVSGVHWMYKTPSHAAELTAGYYNANDHQPYFRLAQLFGDFDVYFDFTCMEMTDASQPAAAYSGPQELVFQVIAATRAAEVVLTGENALAVNNLAGYNQMLVSRPALKSLTYLRLGAQMMQKANFQLFGTFVKGMQAQDFTTPFSLT